MCKCNGSLHPSTQLHTPITKPVRPVSPLSYHHRNQYTPFLPTNNTRICCYSNRLGWKFASFPVCQSFRKLSPAFFPRTLSIQFLFFYSMQKQKKTEKFLSAEKMCLGCFLLCEHSTPWTKTGLKIVWILWGRSIHMKNLQGLLLLLSLPLPIWVDIDVIHRINLLSVSAYCKWSKTGWWEISKCCHGNLINVGVGGERGHIEP